MRRLALLLVAAALAGCSGEPGDDGEYSVVTSPDYSLPGETLEDWVSFGDQLSVVSVVEAEPPRGDGPPVRDVTVRVDRTLWRRADAPRRRGTFRFDVWGFNEGRPMVSEGTARLEPGGRYLTVLVRLRREWHPLTDRAVMTLSRDGVVTSEVVGAPPAPAAAALRGMTLREAADRLATTPPHPAAARHNDKSPRRRWLAVARADR